MTLCTIHDCNRSVRRRRGLAAVLLNDLVELGLKAKEVKDAPMQRWFAVTLLVAVAATSPSRAASVLRTEPPTGALREGETVLLNDGTCPKG